MKPVILLLGLLFTSGEATSPPVPVHVAFAPLTRPAYLLAQKSCVQTKPRVTFPLKKQGRRIVIPTVKGQRVFEDKYINTDRDDQQQFEYAGYLPDFETHVIVAHLWERTNYLLLQPSGREIVLYDEPIYSPDGHSFVVFSKGLEYSVYPNSIGLFRYENRTWREVWQTEPKTWEPGAICWLSATTLLLRKETWAEKTAGKTYTYAKLSFTSDR